MPTFSELFPAFLQGEPYQAEGVGEIYAIDDLSPCTICSTPTAWVETCVNGFMCSTECSAKFWDAVDESFREMQAREVFDETRSEGCAF